MPDSAWTKGRSQWRTSKWVADASFQIRDHKERSDYLEQLKDQFISIISPSVVAAFASQSSESAQYFAKVFGELARLDDLEKYYRKSLKVQVGHLVLRRHQWTSIWFQADISQRWSELVQSDDAQDASELMNSFFDYLLSLWFSQVSLQWFYPARAVRLAFSAEVVRTSSEISWARHLPWIRGGARLSRSVHRQSHHQSPWHLSESCGSDIDCETGELHLWITVSVEHSANESFRSSGNWQLRSQHGIVAKQHRCIAFCRCIQLVTRDFQAIRLFRIALPTVRAEPAVIESGSMRRGKRTYISL